MKMALALMLASSLAASPGVLQLPGAAVIPQTLGAAGTADVMEQGTALNQAKLNDGKKQQQMAVAFGNDPTGAALGGFPGMADIGKGMQMPQRRYSARF